MRILLGCLLFCACSDWVAPIAPAVEDCRADDDCSDGMSCHEKRCLLRTATCTLNGRLEAGEACDDGNTSDLDACTQDCRLARCGDGLLRDDLEAGDLGFEACDDGNALNIDACTNECRRARCGDGLLREDLTPEDENYENCDDGNTDNNDDCTNECAQPRCGDGHVGPEEACDDGNDVSTDDCTAGCLLPRCGDGFQRTTANQNEECDDGNQRDGDGCSADCYLEFCGNGRVELGESCDDGNEDDGDDCANTCGKGFIDLDKPLGHGCAVHEHGFLRCWGKNSWGQVRSGSTDLVSRPRLVPGIETAQRVSLTADSTCVLNTDGSIQCWGRGFTDRNWQEPVRVGSPDISFVNFVALASTPENPVYQVTVLATDARGRVYRIQQGEITPLPDMGTVVEIAGRNSPDCEEDVESTCDGFACARNTQGEVYCWGNNDYGQLGNNSLATSPEPVRVLSSDGQNPLSGAQQLSVGQSAACVIALGNGIGRRTLCWGHRFGTFYAGGAVRGEVQPPMDLSPRLGTDVTKVWVEATSYTTDIYVQKRELWSYRIEDVPFTDEDHTRPVIVDGLRHAQKLAIGPQPTQPSVCALTPEQEIYCWGSSDHGQLGLTQSSWRPLPHLVRGLMEVEQVVAGGRTTCALQTNGEVRCWGNDDGGARGDGFFWNQDITPAHAPPTPLAPQAINNAVLGKLVLELGNSYTHQGCVADAANQYWCWGSDLGLSPVSVPTLDGFDRLSIGGSRVCGLNELGRPHCGDFSSELEPFLGFPDDFVELHNANGALCGFNSEGEVWCARPNALGGWPATAHRIVGLPSVRYLSGANGAPRHCIISEEDEVICWGRPLNGSNYTSAPLGVPSINNTFNEQLLPVDGVMGVPNQIAQGMGTTCVLLQDGSVMCWGDGLSGSFGDGTEAGSRTTPEWVQGLPSIRQISAGPRHFCAVTETGGNVMCWGNNAFNQVGDGYRAQGVERPTRLTGY